MNLFTLKNKGKYFYLILISSAILVIITVLALSFILFVNFENIGISMTNNYMNDILNQISYTSNYLSQSSKSVGVQILLDADVKKVMYKDNPDHMTVNNAINRITLYRNTAPFIESIYIYNEKLDKFYSTRFVSAPTDEMRKIITESKTAKSIVPYPLEMHDLKGRKQKIFSFVFSQNLPGAVIINVKEEWLRNLINSLNVQNSNKVFMIDKAGNITSHPSTDKFMLNVSNEEYIKKILSSDTGNGCFVSKVEGVKSIVSFSSSEVIGWNFISVIPYSIITKPIDLMRFKAVVICTAILLSSLIFAFILSFKVYSPLNKVVSKIINLSPEKNIKEDKQVDEFKLISNRFSNILDQIDHLKEQKRNSLRIIKNQALMNLLTGVSLQNNSSIHKMLQDSNLKINLQSKFQLILLKIDNYRNFITANDFESCTLFRYAIGNICEEILDPFFPMEIVDSGNDHIVIILNGPNLFNEANHTLHDLIKEIQNSVHQYLNLSLSAALSSIASDITELNKIYKEVCEISTYRINYGHQCILMPETIKNINSDNYTYPVDKEKALTDAIKLGTIKNAEEIYNEIIKQCSSYSSEIINLCIMRLAFAISNTLSLIEKNSRTGRLIDFNSFINDLSSKETIEQINAAFIKLLKDIAAEFENKKNNKYQMIIDTIIEKINKYYYDPNLTVNSIADDLNMSPVYSSKIFKEYTSESILDYINRIKLDKAKELLTESNFSINEISGKVGFINPKYFYTFFKKKTGVTPNEFRNRKNL